ncbi:CotH kinase family protein [Amycolatopsis sp. FDAARGOS 1241]|uniref:CotH kinase family protein n=1 Tax=Amycolatopsis sp. FDAARGOS 1241 TaxID=2778070 RepID=UPI00195206C2|nr:CotH kinase family protein [Amycolatopsis sp. FDAARGOS 1241]QRP49405.1 CotH kinase family protein [Amycolatopsis sp. FDAARGOS 1241]
MSAQEQHALDSLYEIDNVLTVDIVMPRADWDAVRTEEPAGGRCNFDWTGRSRFTWRKATSVEISGTKFPARTSFAEVGIKKKSFCGSFSNDKPCLHLDFGKFRDANKPLIANLIGSRYLTLDNSVQDSTFVRQPLGYKLLELAGLPHSRCNFARVRVNGILIGQGTAAPAPGVFVNAEPVMPRYLERNFGNVKGNLYELEHNDDFVDGRFDFIGVEDLSKFDDKADLRFAIDHIAAYGLAGAAEVFDLDQFIKLYAMEFFLKHWDGYSGNTNNTYAYNDVDAVTSPGAGDVKFKLIPWGVDQTLQPARHFAVRTSGLLAKLVRNDGSRGVQLSDQIRTYRDTVFGRKTQQEVLTPLFERMGAVLTGLGVPDVPAQLITVRKQLRLATSAGYLCAGLPGPDGAYVREDATNECLHASTEPIPAVPGTPPNFEVVHRPRPGAVEDSDLWSFGALGAGTSVTSKATGRFLHASAMTSPQGHQLLYTCAASNSDHADEFSVTNIDPVGDDSSFSGYFTLSSIRTGQGAVFGTDPTQDGSPRVYQGAAPSKLYFT